MAAPGLAAPANKALATLDREWDGLIAHRDFPVIGLDNNPAERQIRGPVVTRKNAGGSRNGDSARLAAVIWTVTATVQMAGLNLLTWLTAYRRQVPPRPRPRTIPALERQPRRPPRLGTTASPRLKPRSSTPSTAPPHEKAAPAISVLAHGTSEYLRFI